MTFNQGIEWKRPDRHTYVASSIAIQLVLNYLKIIKNDDLELTHTEVQLEAVCQRAIL